MTDPRGALATRLVHDLRAAGCVFAEEEARLLLEAASDPVRLADMARRRCAGEPLEYVLGWAEFCGLRIAVEPGVFVPRQRTRTLAEHAIAQAHRDGVVLDLCCGSGAIAAALAHTIAGLEIWAADSSAAAVRCARRNLAPWDGRVYRGDLFEPLPTHLRGRVDVLTANVPYVPTDDLALLPAEARDHEPTAALDGGIDGLEVMRRVTTEAADWLAPGGWFGTECSQQQAPSVAAALCAGGLDADIHYDARYGGAVVTARMCEDQS